MSREIKFRGKRIDNGEWITGSYIFTYNCCYIINNEYICIGEDDPTKDFIEVIPETVGQFTGLKDSKGVDIFEGDIIRYKLPDPPTEHNEIEWLESETFSEQEDEVVFKDGCFEGDSIPLYVTLYFEVEVIGNIHDK